MQYLDKLKKERSIDRVIFLAGMVLAFIGFIVPTVYVKQIVTEADLTVLPEAQVSEASETEAAAESEELIESVESADEESAEAEEVEESVESDEAVAEEYEYEDDAEYKVVHIASRKEIVFDYKKKYKKDEYGKDVLDSDGNPEFTYILNKNGEKIKEKIISYNHVLVDAQVDEEGEYILDDNGNMKLSYNVYFDKDGKRLPDDQVIRIKEADLEKEYKTETNVFNLFGAAKVFNQNGLGSYYNDYDYVNEVNGTAYNATFLVVIWLCTIAGIVLFFLTKTIIGDVLVSLIALAFGIASVIAVSVTLNVTPIVGYFSVGGYMVIVGIALAIAGTVLGAAHIQHPDQVKSN
ncbi:hypothetical protein [Treponema sp.]|uniref:hypothetical protein n=1 Tax=Treponema sp. TaxID=166 RepID=UPI00388D6F9C